MPTIDDIINLALSQVGMTENPPYTNNVIYNSIFYGHPVMDGVALNGLPDPNAKYPWCAVFIWWIYSQFDPCLVKKTASCMDMAQWFKDNGQWIEPGYQQRGDIAFYKFDTNNRWTNHTGICTEVLGENDINAVEGNTSVSDDCNGGSVRIRHRTLNIVGYGRPKYSSAAQYFTGDKFGIDISKYQGSINFKLVKAAGISYVILRTITKDLEVDPRFQEYLQGCIDNCLPYSYYKYNYAKTHDEARREADLTINLIKDHKAFIWYDLEDKEIAALGSDAIEGITLAFAAECNEAGFEVGIYCNKTWYDNYISQFLKDRFKFWIARYSKEDNGTIPEQLRPDYPNAVMWQYSSKGKVPGINANVDLDVLL